MLLLKTVWHCVSDCTSGGHVHPIPQHVAQHVEGALEDPRSSCFRKVKQRCQCSKADA